MNLLILALLLPLMLTDTRSCCGGARVVSLTQHFDDIPTHAGGSLQDSEQHPTFREFLGEQFVPSLLTRLHDELENQSPSTPSTLSDLGLLECSTAMTGIHAVAGKFHEVSTRRTRKIFSFEKRSLKEASSIRTLLFTSTVVYHAAPITKARLHQPFGYHLKGCIQPVEFQIKVVARANKTKIFTYSFLESVTACRGEETILKRYSINISRLLPHFLFNQVGNSTSRRFAKLFLHVRPMHYADRGANAKFIISIPAWKSRTLGSDGPLLLFVRGAADSPLHCPYQHTISNEYLAEARQSMLADSKEGDQKPKVIPQHCSQSCARIPMKIPVVDLFNGSMPDLLLQNITVDVGRCSGECSLNGRHRCDSSQYVEHPLFKFFAPQSAPSVRHKRLPSDGKMHCYAKWNMAGSKWFKYALRNVTDLGNRHAMYIDTGIVKVPKAIYPEGQMCYCGYSGYH